MSGIGHAICIGCHPNLDGPARCGTLPDVHQQSATITCAVCADLDGAPCEHCQPDLYAVWVAMGCDGATP